MRGHKGRPWLRRAQLAGVALALALASSACDSPSMLDPKGPRAGKVADLWWVTLVIGAIVWLIVVFAIVLGAIVRRRSPVDRARDPVWWVVAAGAIVPMVILSGVTVYTLRTVTAVAKKGDSSSLTIEVSARQWWWQVSYPDQKFTTANELHIPVNEPVRVKLSSQDVIHSFWIPQLQGKMDAIPGRDNELWIEADKPGTYRGECAEFCGLQHANMAFVVVAESRSDFDAWTSSQEQEPSQPTDASVVKGQQVFLGSACAYCHTVKGTTASGTLGPDLTHVASRSTLASGALANTRGALAGWVLDPQSTKPNTQMPPTQMNGEDLQALLDYLESLK